MNRNKIICEILIVCFVFCSSFGETVSLNNPQEDNSDSALQIYLPREISIQENTLLLGEISIARGSETLIKKANKVTLGSFSIPGQEIALSRQTILSRLASNGILASDVTFIGAEEIKIKQKQRIITGEDFVNLADSYLKEKIINKSVIGLKPVRAARELVIHDSAGDINYSYSIDKNVQGSQVSVDISVLSGEKNLGSRSITFRLEYENRVPVAVTDIVPGESLTHENVKIEKKTSNYPEPINWKEPFGMLARRVIKANTVIQNDMIGSAELQTIIKRNQNVVIRVEKTGFVITAAGKTMQDGKVGDFIKVKNIDSQRIIIVKVNEDGSVEPI
jgi:flagellar basal body P-ring formation protein FlgA